MTSGGKPISKLFRPGPIDMKKFNKEVELSFMSPFMRPSKIYPALGITVSKSDTKTPAVTTASEMNALTAANPQALDREVAVASKPNPICEPASMAIERRPEDCMVASVKPKKATGTIIIPAASNCASIVKDSLEYEIDTAEL